MRAAVTVRGETCRSLGMSIGLMLLACTPTGMRAALADPPSLTSAPASGSAKTDHLPQITIEASRLALEQRVQAFVDELSHSRRFPDRTQPAPRWEEPLCFEVAGLPRKYAEVVAAQLSQIATSVGAPVRENCSRLSANFYALFTPDPTETLRYLKRHPLVLQDRIETGLPQIERFLNPPKSVVVRVWHDAESLSWDGTPCVLAPNGLWLACSGKPGGSRITLSSTPSFARALVVIDSTRIQGFQLGQISAYVAMVGLVDIDGDVNVRETPSILRLFTDSPEQRAEGITEWDRAFLTALYHTNQWNAQQRKQIANKMVDEIAH